MSPTKYGDRPVPRRQQEIAIDGGSVGPAPQEETAISPRQAIAQALNRYTSPLEDASFRSRVSYLQVLGAICFEANETQVEQSRSPFLTAFGTGAKLELILVYFSGNSYVQPLSSTARYDALQGNFASAPYLALIGTRGTQAVSVSYLANSQYLQTLSSGAIALDALVPQARSAFVQVSSDWAIARYAARVATSYVLNLGADAIALQQFGVATSYVGVTGQSAISDGQSQTQARPTGYTQILGAASTYTATGNARSGYPHSAFYLLR